jgi:hypothetical protein
MNWAERKDIMDPIEVSFRTHLNYIKCIDKLLSSSQFSIQKDIDQEHIRLVRNDNRTNKFKRLNNTTFKSIKKDLELAQANPEFSIIIAPWFPVKCYYALYYLESILIYLISNNLGGFSKGGHSKVRKEIYSSISRGDILFNQSNLNIIYKLKQIEGMAPIISGSNNRGDYWESSECIESVAKILMRYKMEDAKLGRKWNLRKPKYRLEKEQFISQNKLALIDLFYWYRIKANYRELDYMDIENGADDTDILNYIKIYYNAFSNYNNGLDEQINLIIQQ